ncbi:MAG: hypothetical protein KF819_32300 [Labilithrix sp.]|nr:hypothetical protein [Labilithrix sp.]
MRRTTRALALGGAISAAGCSLLTSLDGLSTPSRDVADDGSPGPNVDAGADDAPVPDAAPPEAAVAFCLGQTDYRLCEDFDDGGLPGQFELKEEKRGSVGRSTALAFSPPGALETKLFAQTTDDDSYAHLRASFDPAGSAISLGYSIRITSAPGDQSIEIGAIEIETQAGAAYNVHTVYNAKPNGNDEIILREYLYTTGTVNDLLGPFKVKRDEWFSLRVRLDAFAGAGELQLNGVSMGSRTLSPPPAAVAGATKVRVYLGVYTYGKHGDWSALYDNAIIRYP